MSDVAYFVADEAGSRGPLSTEALRGVIGPETNARVRADGCNAWLPAEAWEALTDLRPAPPIPPPPPAEPSTDLPPEIMEIPLDIREKLVWFVSDTDGLMGPVSGEYIRSGLATSKIKMGAGICLVSTGMWIRASVVFPRALEGATMVRPRPLNTFPCPACFEPCAPLDRECLACSEPIAARPRPIPQQKMALIVAAAWGAVLFACIVFGLIARLIRTPSAPSAPSPEPAPTATGSAP